MKQSSFSIASAILNEGIVLPILLTAIIIAANGAIIPILNDEILQLKGIINTTDSREGREVGEKKEAVEEEAVGGAEIAE
jgi:hypothetical protein